MKLELDLKITEEDIDDIMVTALEGGINYWCPQVSVVGQMAGENIEEQISNGGKLELVEEHGVKHILDLKKFQKGLEKYISQNKDCLAWETKQGKYLLSEKRTGNLILDTGMIDSVAADCIIQYALFGNLIYG